jgi:hypothetical protein
VKRNILGALALFSLIVVAGDAGVCQTGFKFEPDTRARLMRMIHREPAACVDLIERAESLVGLRQALVQRVEAEFTNERIIEAVRALKDLGLSEEMTLRELREAADAAELEAGD